LGRIFHGVHLTDDQAYILDQFVRLVSDVRPDAILIAGDIYDRAIPPTEAVALLDDVLTQIVMDHKVPTIVIAGNHDSPERLGFGTRLLARQKLHVFGQLTLGLAPLVLHDVHGPVYFCPLPYAEPPVVRERLAVQEATDHNLAMLAIVNHFSAQIPPRVRRVALAHAFVSGGKESESERPLSVGGTGTVAASCFHAFDYVALGHLHQPQSAGGEHIFYAGSLMKYSFSEVSQRKTVALIEMDGTGSLRREEFYLTPRRDVRCLGGYLQDILAEPRHEDYLLVTLKDTGAIFDVMGQLRAVHPNVLQVGRSFLAEGGKLRGPGSDHRRMSELELFSSFFVQVTGEELSGAQTKVFTDTAEAVNLKAREVQA